MKTAVEELSPTRVKLTVEAPFDELEPSLKAAYKKIAAQVRVPGFRPGKVPARIIDQRFGRGLVLEEAVNAAVPDLYGRAVSESNLFPLGTPEIEVTRLDDGKEIEFTAEVDVRPTFEIPAFQDIEITVNDADVTDDDVDEQIKGLRERFATLTGADRAAEKGDYVSVDLSAAIDGDRLDDQQASGVSYEVGGGSMLAGLDDALEGMAAGDVKTFSTTLVGGTNAGEEADVTITVHSVKAKVLPELDDEFAQTASEFDTLEELRADVRKRIERNKLMNQTVQARDKAVEALVDKVEIPIPEAVLENEITRRKEALDQQIEQSGLGREAFFAARETSEGDFLSELEKDAGESIKAGFLLDQLAVAEEMGVDDSELTEFVVHQSMRMGVAPNVLAKHLTESGQLHVAISEVLRAKAMTLIADSARVTDESGRDVDLKAIREDLSGETAQPGQGGEAVQDEDDEAKAE